METWMRESSSTFSRSSKTWWQQVSHWLNPAESPTVISSLALPHIQQGWGDGGGSVPAHAWWQRAQVCQRWQPGLLFCLIFPPFKEVIFIFRQRWEEGVCSRGSCWSPALLPRADGGWDRFHWGHLAPQGWQQLFVPAQHFVPLGAGLTSPIQSDLLEKSRVIKLPLKLQERPVFFTKFNLIFFPHPNLTWKWL